MTSASVLHERPWSGTGVALLPLLAVALDKMSLESLIVLHPSFALSAYREITFRFMRAIDAWKNQVRLTPSETLARYILSYALVRQRAGIDPRQLLPIRQADLGRATGLRRETVNRVLGAWVEEGRLAVHARGLSEIRIERMRELITVDPL